MNCSMKLFFDLTSCASTALWRWSREDKGSRISPRGLKLVIPRVIISNPAARSKNRESLTKIPRFDMNRPMTKNTIAIPRVKATPINRPSLGEDLPSSGIRIFLL